MSAARIGIAGIGLTSPLGDDLGTAWERLLAGQGAVGRVAFDGLPAIAAAQVRGELAHGLTRLQQVGTERVSQMALAAVRKALADARVGAWACTWAPAWAARPRWTPASVRCTPARASRR